MDFQSFGFVGAIKSLNFQKIFGKIIVSLLIYKQKFVLNLNWNFFLVVTHLYIRTIAFDMRGYNLSERPTGSDNYKISYLIEDLRALVEHLSMYWSRLFNFISFYSFISNILEIFVNVIVEKKLFKFNDIMTMTMTHPYLYHQVDISINLMYHLTCFLLLNYDY